MSTLPPASIYTLSMMMTSYDVSFNPHDHAKCCQAHFIDEETEAQKMGLHSVEMAFEMNSEQG